MKSCPTCQATYPTHYSVCPTDGTPLRSMTELHEGAIVRGKYQIISKLGQGGMGVVYKARHVRFDEICALKLVSSSLAQDATFLQRFHAEALLMRKLDHPNALRVHDVDETEDGRPFIVMEFVEGESLSGLLRDGAPLDPARAARIAMQACEGLGAAHRLGIIHRDIKPPNIMVSRAADGTEHVKVFDFGIAKVKEGSALHGGVSLTQTGLVVGTPSYMSPEQAQGLRGDKLDARTDLYSLGVVLYEMLTGRTPFAAETPVALLLAHIQQQPPDPRDLQAALPPTLVDVVFRALEKDPEKRFATAEEMRDALKAVLDLEEISLGSTVRVLPRRGPASGDAAKKTEMMTPTTPPAFPRAAAGPTEHVVTPPRVPAAQRPAPEPVAEPAPVSVAPKVPYAPEPPARFPVTMLVIGALAMLLLGGGGYFVWNRMQTSPAVQPPPAQTQPASSVPAKPEVNVPPQETPQKAETAPRKAVVPAASSDAQEVQRMVRSATAAMDAGRYDEAIRTFEAVLLLEPNQQTAQRGLDRAKRAKAAEDAILKGKP